MSGKRESLIARLKRSRRLAEPTEANRTDAPIAPSARVHPDPVPTDPTPSPDWTPSGRPAATKMAYDAKVRIRDELTVFIVAGEHSGDLLGAGLMRELANQRKSQMRFIGVGGEAMEAAGLTSLFPLADIAVMGPVAILRALPRLTNRVFRTVAAGVAANPDIIVIIDSPEFTHRVAKRLRRKLPGVPVIDYVCPSVWAWRPGRAKKMARFIDHVLALLPFEPATLERLKGPPATYVGHPLSGRQVWINAIDIDVWAARLELDRTRPSLVVLPGSRRSEVEVLMPVFGETIGKLHEAGYRCNLLLPCVPHLRPRIEELSSGWPMSCHFIDNEEAKFAAFRMARAALAASGTVTLELGVAGTPMVVGYIVDRFAAKLRFLMKAESVVLANLVLGENAFPELLQEECNPETLSKALIALIDDTPARARQLEALARLAVTMSPPPTPASRLAAHVVMKYAEKRVLPRPS